MVNVTIFRENHNIIAYEVSGHAGSGPYGYDLVCAGVSAVTFGMTNAVIELCQTDVKAVIDDEGGYLHVTLPNQLDDHTSEQAQILLEGMLISLRTIENNYGQFIEINEK